MSKFIINGKQELKSEIEASGEKRSDSFSKLLLVERS